MIDPLWLTSGITLALGLGLNRLGISAAHRFKLLDYPGRRRRHSQPTPIVGGLCILLTTSLSLCLYLLLVPNWAGENIASLIPFAASLLILTALGLVDDVVGLNPLPKLLFQGLATAIVLNYEPHIHEVCHYWQAQIGPVIWLLAAIWIVGITNAINLIDGLDGLAGGTSLLVCSSILLLAAWSGPDARFVVVLMGLLIPAVIAFLFYNWHPARNFLGDNGSLPLGFVIASTSLMCRPQSKSWIMLASIVIMLGYPILDMGLAVSRRYRSGLRLFKADRIHLHYRFLRLGLSVRQTAVLLLSICIYLQITALMLNLMSPLTASLGLALVGFSLFSILFMLRGIELNRVTHLSGGLLVPTPLEGSRPPIGREMALRIGLEPLLEAGLHEERLRCTRVVTALETTLRSLVRKGDLVVREGSDIWIVLQDFKDTPENCRRLKLRLHSKIEGFFILLEVQCSLSSLPVSVELQPQSMMPTQGALVTLDH